MKAKAKAKGWSLQLETEEWGDVGPNSTVLHHHSHLTPVPLPRKLITHKRGIAWGQNSNCDKLLVCE